MHHRQIDARVLEWQSIPTSIERPGVLADSFPFFVTQRVIAGQKAIAMTTRLSFLVPDSVSEESINFGCPMLIRAATEDPVHPGRVLMRCSLGWAIHGSDDVARCASTNTVEQCWHLHTEEQSQYSSVADKAESGTERSPMAAD